ncbi:MAG: hypothetical protein ACM3YE_04085 [Bacteroidota bacterium]
MVIKKFIINFIRDLMSINENDNIRYDNLIEELISLYNNKLTYTKLIFKYLKSYRLFLVFVMLLLIFVIIINSYFKNDTILIRRTLYISGFIFAFLLITFPLLESFIIKKYYRNSLDNYRIEQLLESLNYEDRFKYEKLDDLIQVIYNMAESKKYSGYIFKSSVYALFIPIWTSYIKWSYDHITSKVEALFFFLGFSFLICIFIVITKLLKDYLDSDSDKLKELAKLLEKIYFNQEFRNKQNELKGKVEKCGNI